MKIKESKQCSVVEPSNFLAVLAASGSDSSQSADSSSPKQSKFPQAPLLCTPSTLEVHQSGMTCIPSAPDQDNSTASLEEARVKTSADAAENGELKESAQDCGGKCSESLTECRPAFVGWENVEGALSRGCREVVAGLRMVGYQVEGPIIVSAEELGAPHQRKRIFVVGYANHLSPIVERTGGSWEEQIGEQLEMARQYSYSQNQRCSAGLQQRGERWHELDRLLETGNTRIHGLEGNLTHQESKSQCRVTRQPAPVHSPHRIGESAGVGMDDGIPQELVRVDIDAPWLLGIDRSGWWRREPPPVKAGLRGKRIKGRRDCINHYGAACVPGQAIPLALRITPLLSL